MRFAATNESFYLKLFSDLGLAESLLHAVSAEGYTNPTPIQAEVIPAMLAGRDIVGIAQTGTGKTAAFVLPLLHQIKIGQPATAAKSCNTLVLVPTRELAAQIAVSVRTYGRNVRHSSTVIVGGAKPGPQIRAMARGVDIVVATPGRLLDHMSTGAVRLDATTTIILDEADQMMDLGFMPAIRQIMAKLPAKRQTILLSATMPKQIRALASDFLKSPMEIAVAPAARPIDKIEQKVLHVTSASKRGVLVELLQAPEVERAIVFTRTKHGADRVHHHLQKAGLSAEALHGNKSQGQRERILGAFRNGRVTILVATDIAARGIDVDDVSHVINFELPNVAEVYVHRIGRTARAGKSGFAISLCDPTERLSLRGIERLVGYPLRAENRIEGSTSLAPPPAPDRGGPRKRRSGSFGAAESRGKGRPHGKPAARRSGGRRSQEASHGGLARMLGSAAGSS